MEKKRRFKGILATALILSMMMQLVAGAAPVYTWEEPAETWREETGLQKTISVSESEIRDSLKEWKWAPELDEEIIPFEEFKKEAAIEVLEQKLEGTVIVRQEDLGDDCSAIVAVRAEEKRKNADIHNVILIGLNGNENQACEFVLEIVNEGGIVVKRTVITEYGTLGPWATPSDATPSDATPSDATESNAEDTDEELEADMGDIMLINDLFPEAEDYVEAEDLSTASDSKATSSNYNKEDTGFFSRSYTYALEPNEINGMVMDEEEVEEEKPNLFMRIARFFSFNDGDEADGVSLATDSNIAEKEDGAADVESIPAVMYALPGSMAVAETEDMITSWSGNRMYFTNMYDPDFGKGLLLGEDQHRALPYAAVKAVFTQPGKDQEKKEVLLAYYTPGVYVCVIPESEDEKNYIPSVEDGNKTEADIIKVKRPYTKVTFYVKPAIEPGEELPWEQDEDGFYWIGREYRFLGEGNGSSSDESRGNVLYEPINLDTLFYSGRIGRPLSEEEMPEEPLPLDAYQTATSYWSAHPISTPQTLAGEFIYFDVRKRNEDGEIVLGKVTGEDDNGNPYLWLHYGNCTGDEKCNDHRITLETTTDGIYYYQIPYDSGLNEDSVLVVRGRGEREVEEGVTVPGEGPGKDQKPGFPFTWSLKMKESRNMLILSTLESGGKKWGTYTPNFLEGDRYIGFDNTLTDFKPGDTTKPNDPDGRDQLVAVLWECKNPDLEAGTKPADRHAHWQWDEEAFLELCKTEAKDIWHLEDEKPTGSVYVAMLKPTNADHENQYKPEVWNQIEDVWGIMLPEQMKWEHTHIRFIHYTGTKTYNSNVNGHLEAAAGLTQEETQAQLLRELADQLKKAIIKENGNYVYTDEEGKPVYVDNNEIHKFSQILTVNNSYDYPCFFGAPGHNDMPMHGRWDMLRSPHSLGDESLNIPKGEFQYDPSLYYATADFYDYYSDYEMTGHNRADYLSRPEPENEGEKPSSKKHAKKNPYPVTLEAEQEILRGKANMLDDQMGTQGYTLNNAIYAYYKEIEEEDPEALVGHKALGDALFFGSGDYNKRPEATKLLYTTELKNTWGRTQDTGHKGIMQTTLSNGELRTEHGYSVPYFNEAFLRGDNSENLALGKAYKQVLFPFKYDESGYWSFDSSDPNDGVRMMQDENSDMYFLRRGKEHAVGLDHRNYGVRTNPHYLFMPFTDAFYNEEGELVPYQERKAYENPNGLPKLNYMFGIKMTIPFTLTPDGTVEMPGKEGKQDIVFRFSGDDDVWIYIDDQLVMDLGGIHDFMQAEINFNKEHPKVTYRGGITDPTPLEKVPVPWDTITGWRHKDTVEWNVDNFDYNAPHTMTIFYLERGLIASNLRMSFNFVMNNSFEVENKVDTSNIDALSTKNGGNMEPKLAELAKYVDNFGFNITTAATKGEKLPYNKATGYIKPGGQRYYNQGGKLVPGMAGIHWNETSENNEPTDKTASDVWFTSAGGISGSGDRDQIAFRSREVTDTTITDLELERRLINIYPTAKGTGGQTVSWPNKIKAPESDKEDIKDVVDDPPDAEGEDAAYLSLQVWNSEKASDNGSILYVGLIDGEGRRVGGWANTLTYGASSNRIGEGWNTIRIDKTKLLASGDPNFDAKNIQAVQVCYHDDREGAVRDIRFHGIPDLSQEIDGFYVDDEDISDYNSIQGEKDSRYSELSPAYGAWYNTEAYVDTEASEKPETGSQRQPAMVNQDGRFYLGRNDSAVFTDKFRVGSYISVNMDELDKQIYTTTWTLEEDGEPIEPIWLSAVYNVRNIKYQQISVDPWDQPGTSPRDGREQTAVGAHETIVKNNDMKGTLKDKSTVLYRSYQYPDNASDGFHIGVSFKTVMDTAGIVIKKELAEGVEDGNKEYHFAIVYDDVANTGLELHLENPFIVQGIDIQAGEAAYVDVIAGTEYRIYELDRSLTEIQAELPEGQKLTAVEDLFPYLDGSLLYVETGKAEKTGDVWNVSVDVPTEHTNVTTYSKSDANGWDITNHGHASGNAYAKDKDGNDGDGVQGFVFTNGPVPETGTAKIALVKAEKGIPDADVIPSRGLNGARFALYYAENADGPYELYHGGAEYTTQQIGSEDGAVKGVFVVEDLPDGYYYFAEREAPSGYIPSNPNKTYGFSVKGEEVNINSNDYKLNHGLTIEGETLPTIRVDNEKFQEASGNVTLTKYNSGRTNTLKGAEFDLYKWKPTEGEGGSQTPKYDPWNTEPDNESGGEWGKMEAPFGGPWVTGPDGKFEIKGLPFGHYAFLETKAPDGYICPEPTDEKAWLEFELSMENNQYDIAVEMTNTSRFARFRIRKYVKMPFGNQDAYKHDPFLIKVRDEDTFYTELVLKHDELSDYIIVDVGQTGDAEGKGVDFRIEEVVPMEYNFLNMELEAGYSGKAGLKKDADETYTLTIYPEADVIVRVNNEEKHINYFHDLAYVTNTTSSGDEWVFHEKEGSRDPDGQKYDQKHKNPLAFLIPDQDGKRGKKEDDEQNDSAE